MCHDGGSSLQCSGGASGGTALVGCGFHGVNCCGVEWDWSATNLFMVDTNR
jgi:hypothetical protein